MKTAISLPDELGHAADLFAQQRELSRSELYARALREYLDRHRHDDLTSRIDAMLAKAGTSDRPGERGVAALRNLPW